MTRPIFITSYEALARFDTMNRAENDPVIQAVTQAYREAPAGKCPHCGKPSLPDSKFCSELCCSRWWSAIEKEAIR